jgi:acyl-CoA oxidase
MLPGAAAPQVVMLCCGIKPLCGWNAEEAASVCRERCGGQGYLSCNKFGAIIGFAHAGGWAGGWWSAVTAGLAATAA